MFDTSKTVMLTGTLTKVDWRNPHIELSLDVADHTGRVEVWVLQGAPPFFFRERDIDRSRFENAVGQPVTVEVYGARNGMPLGALRKLIFADGTSVAIVPDA